jgi:alkylresorcinol/alkylpyrone synthase
VTRIVAVAPVLPGHAYAQADITAVLGPLIAPDPVRRASLERLHAASGVATRHLVLPLEDYAGLRTFGQANGLFVTAGLDLAERAVRRALDDAGLVPEDVDFLLFTSVTGISAPSLDALLVARLGLRTDVKRIPVFGLGCVAGAAGLARVHDYLVGHPHDVGVLVSVELCSLTLQHGDSSMANLVSSGLFGDGVAAAVLVGDERARRLEASGPDVVATRSNVYPDTEDVLGWDVGGSGFRIVLAASLADLVERNVGDDVVDLLHAHDLKVADVASWLAHPGGPRILDALTRTLDLPDDALDASRRALAAMGNVSSAAVLHVLAAAMAQGDHVPGSPAVLLALGPGVSAETVLLRWPDEEPT